MKKGLKLRPWLTGMAMRRRVGSIALMKKGLKLTSQTPRVAVATSQGWKYCPDEEGIETPQPCAATELGQGWKYCPDEEGIETSRSSVRGHARWVGSIALMKKGLKPDCHRPSQGGHVQLEVLP